jgi:hypothetical protein
VWKTELLSDGPLALCEEGVEKGQMTAVQLTSDLIPRSKTPYKTLAQLIFECGRPNFCLMASLPSVRRVWRRGK